MFKSTFTACIAATLLGAAHLAAAKTVVIDVRTPGEFAQSHIDGALNIDHSVIQSRISEANVTKDDTIILYCRSGRRSGLAQDVLQKMGYAKAQNYGGMEEARQKLQKR